MVYSVEIPIAMLLRTHDVLMFFVDEVMKFLPPVGSASHFNTASVLRRNTLVNWDGFRDLTGCNTDNEVITEEMKLYNWLRDAEYWKMIEDHSWFGNIRIYQLRKHVEMMMNDMKDYICYRGLAAPIVCRPRNTKETRKRLCPWTQGQLVHDVVLPVNESCQNNELLRLFCQGPWPASYVGFTREGVLDEIFSTLRFSLEEEGDFASVIDVDHLYTAVVRGFHWHNIGFVMFAGRRLVHDPYGTDI